MGFLDRMVADMVTKSTGFNARGLVRMVGGRRMMVLGGAALAGAMMQDKMQGSTILQGTSPGGSTSASGTRQVPRSSREMQARMASAETVPLPPLPSDIASQAPPPPPAASAEPPPPPVPEAAAAADQIPPPPPAPGAPEGTDTVPPPPPSVSSVGDTVPLEQPAELPNELVFAIMRTMVAASLADGALSGEERKMITDRLDESGLSEEQIGRVQQDLLSPAKPMELAAMVEADDRELLFRFATLIALADDEVTERERTWLNQFGKTLELSPGQIEEIETDIYG